MHFDEIQVQQGVRQTPTQQQQNSPVDHRPGAAVMNLLGLSAEEAFEMTADWERAPHPSTSPDANGELPMVVWLRGDEPHAADFSLTADDAMRALDIKRSRLTQISGHELRVGRMRVDRYVRPLYRPADVESYKQWTRSTVTHQRTSSIIHDAAASLESQAKVISDRLQGTLMESASVMADRLSAHEGRIASIQSEIVRFLRDDMVGLRNEMIDTAERRHASIRDRLDRLETALAPLSSMLARLETSAGSLEGVNATCEQTMAGIRVLRESQQRFAGEVARVLGLILEYQRDADQRRNDSFAAEIKRALGSNASATPSVLPTVAPRGSHYAWTCRRTRRAGTAKR